MNRLLRGLWCGLLVLSSFLGWGASHSQAVLVNLGPGSFVPLAPTIPFSESGHPVGQTNPVYPFTGLPTLGNVTVSFGGHFVGQAVTAGTPVTLSDHTPTGPLMLDPAAPNTFITGDSASPTSPILSGTPLFNGPIA